MLRAKVGKMLAHRWVLFGLLVQPFSNQHIKKSGKFYRGNPDILLLLRHFKTWIVLE